MTKQKELQNRDSLWPPCRNGCPANADVRLYVHHISQARYLEATDVIRRSLPFASVCGRICHHPCEANCRRRDVDESVAIRELKRFTLEQTPEPTVNKPASLDRGKVAVVGSGPSGMSAALHLTWRGFQTVIFEKYEAAGGIPVQIIPPYRLPREAIRADVDWILAHDIELKTGVEIGKDKTVRDLADEGYQAVIIATGLSNSRILPLPGTDHPRVHGVLDFLRSVSNGLEIDVGDDVLVIGGGNVACDAARSAVRYGCGRVRMICLESREEMPAWDWEIEECREEGVEIINRRGPGSVQIADDGSISGLQHKKVTRVFDEEGRFAPEFAEDELDTTSCDTIVFAIGQALDDGFRKGSDLEMNQYNRLSFSPETHMTNLDWVFACGEAVTPPGSVVEACASGKRAAEAVDQYLSQGAVDLAEYDSLPQVVDRIDDEAGGRVTRIKRNEQPVLPPEKRKNTFAPFELGFTAETALPEAHRCLECGNGAEVIPGRCVKCLTCVRVCPFGAPYVDSVAHIDQVRCQACGICVTECPARAITLGNKEVERVEQELEEKSRTGKSRTVAYICGHGASEAQWQGRENIGLKDVVEIYLSSLARLDVSDLLSAFERGAEEVMVAVCKGEDERHPGTHDFMERRVSRLNREMEEMGLGKDRLRFLEVENGGIPSLKKAMSKS
ncbi:MAG: FAD-dependent oxidoreductase [Desulfurivibrionaceae bacterium]